MAVVLDIKVTPKAAQQRIKWDAGVIKVYVANPAEDGKANKELIQLLSKRLSVPQQAITILSGLTARVKRVQIAAALTKNEIFERLGLEVQSAFI